MDLNFILTVMGVALGGVSIGVSVWVAFFIYRKQKDSQTVMDKFVQDSLEMLRTYEQTSFDLLVGIRNNNFQLFARHFETDKSGYWHFKLRFESWNRLSIQVTPDDGESFFLRLEILGTSEDFRRNSMDGIAYEYFFCRVLDSMDNERFKVGEIVTCFYYNGSPYVSKYVGSFLEPEDKLKFIVGGLGDAQSGWQHDIEAGTVKYSPRAKDFKV